jgi:hypothetical protein
MPSRDGRHADRLRELAYVTNVLAAGASLAGRPLRPVEAATAAVATANLGLEQLRAGQGKRATAARLLADTTADRLFLVGESLLFHDLVRPAAERAAALLAKSAAAGDAAAVRSALASGKPWTARRRLDILAARLGQPTFAALAALIDECPTLAGRLAPQGTGSSEFIATQAQLAAARAFLAGLAG